MAATYMRRAEDEPVRDTYLPKCVRALQPCVYVCVCVCARLSGQLKEGGVQAAQDSAAQNGAAQNGAAQNGAAPADVKGAGS